MDKIAKMISVKWGVSMASSMLADSCEDATRFNLFEWAVGFRVKVLSIIRLYGVHLSGPFILLLAGYQVHKEMTNLTNNDKDNGT